MSPGAMIGRLLWGSRWCDATDGGLPSPPAAGPKVAFEVAAREAPDRIRLDFPLMPSLSEDVSCPFVAARPACEGPAASR
jgi:hypothetical protein